MTRWEPDSRARLAQAALELYGERGFENTTVAAIAERAGLTERTFFRHYADKRDVLFAGSDEFAQLFVGAVGAAPAGVSPLDAATAGVLAAAARLEARRAFARQRQAVITASPELQERELIKLARLTEALAAALRERGHAEIEARLAAEVAVAVFHDSFQRWVAAPDTPPLPELAVESLEALRALTAR